MATTQTEASRSGSIIQSDFDIDLSAMSLRFKWCDSNSRDSQGDFSSLEGISLRRHQRNPVVLYGHGKEGVTLPIAITETPSGLYTVEINALSGEGWCTAFFYKSGAEHSHAVVCAQIFDLAVKKLLRAGSYGFRILEATPLDADHLSGAPPGLFLHRVELLEISLVLIPAHEAATKQLLSMPTVCGKPLDPRLRRQFKALAPQKTCQLGYERRSPLKTPQRARAVKRIKAAGMSWMSGAGADLVKPPKQPKAIQYHLSGSIAPGFFIRIQHNGRAFIAEVIDRQSGEVVFHTDPSDNNLHVADVARQWIRNARKSLVFDPKGRKGKTCRKKGNFDSQVPDPTLSETNGQIEKPRKYDRKGACDCGGACCTSQAADLNCSEMERLFDKMNKQVDLAATTLENARTLNEIRSGILDLDGDVGSIELADVESLEQRLSELEAARLRFLRETFCRACPDHEVCKI